MMGEFSNPGAVVGYPFAHWPASCVPIGCEGCGKHASAPARIVVIARIVFMRSSPEVLRRCTRLRSLQDGQASTAIYQVEQSVFVDRDVIALHPIRSFRHIRNEVPRNECGLEMSTTRSPKAKHASGAWLMTSARQWLRSVLQSVDLEAADGDRIGGHETWLRSQSRRLHHILRAPVE